MQANLILISYIFSAILFIVGIKKLGKINTARQGNFLSAVGMLIAILATLFKMDAIPLNWVLGGIALGAVIGAFSAIGKMGSADLSVVAPAISEALIATALCIFVAIPSSAAFNMIGYWVSSQLDIFNFH